MGIFKKAANSLEPGGINQKQPGEEYLQCPVCKRYEPQHIIAKNSAVCPWCGHHYQISARSRLKLVTDRASFNELFTEISSGNPLTFPGYNNKIAKARNDSGETEAVICGSASITGLSAAVFIMEAKFMMGSMGSAVGEKLTRLFEYATEKSLPVVGFCASGGARMQEGILSLMQMAKVSGAVERHGSAENLFISVLTNPTTGGVTASFAMQSDIILCEPGALVGFAGRRVIEKTTRKKLPADFQSAEFVLSHGFIDNIVPRSELKAVLGRLLSQHIRNGGGQE